MIRRNGKGTMDPELIKEVVAETLIEASTTFRQDQFLAYQKAIGREKNPNARWVLERIVQNAEIAEKSRRPLCNDTGIPHLYLEIGEDVTINGKFLERVKEGVRIGLQKLPGRPMAVKGKGLERIGQNLGLYDDPGMLSPAPFQIRTIFERKIIVTVMMLGGGPDIRGKTYHIFHRHQGMNVIEEVAKWAANEAGRLGCTPTIPSIGIGRTNYEATCLMLDAMKEGNLMQQNDIEKSITDAINRVHVGPLGLGGPTTALGSFVKIGPLRAGGARIVSIRLGCCWEPRRATKEIPL
jgi:fumarate hydratase subunit alpha